MSVCVTDHTHMHIQEKKEEIERWIFFSTELVTQSSFRGPKGGVRLLHRVSQQGTHPPVSEFLSAR